jgi:signal transduction histidine kinase
MTRTIRVVEPSLRSSRRDPFQEVACYIRRLLNCEYAFVAVPENDSIRIKGCAGPHDQASDVLTTDLISLLAGWGPIVVDDARLIAAPLALDGVVVGILIGYSSRPGTFTADDLEKLMSYAPAGACVLAGAAVEESAGTRWTFSPEELLHFSRLVTIGELSACFAHEVNNPLTLVRGHLRFVDEALPSNHPLRVNFDVIDRASRRIEEMAKRMLDFSKKRPRSTGRCEVGDLISDALRIVQPYIRAKLVDVQVHLDQQLPILDVDRWQMVQAIVNLLQNATDAMADVDRRILSISATAAHRQIRIVISDTGAGIRPNHISEIFKPFFTTKGERGTGLGLYITRQVIEAHHGTIQVECGSRGTSFVISLPL